MSSPELYVALLEDLRVGNASNIWGKNRQKIQLCNNYSKPANCTTLRLVHRQKLWYNQPNAAEPQLYQPISSNRVRNSNHMNSCSRLISKQLCAQQHHDVCSHFSDHYLMAHIGK
ncbi:hypothetical protein PIB30_034630 [Stylosanthes scabra]|uniref:Uncharacterized protein n=1 Tax=Stylosanthes scabra TaxID=79078 RepID=A0ABU6XCK2_9FABA|nr:hypothetical protein [Stylosanthes scabra]